MRKALILFLLIASAAFGQVTLTQTTLTAGVNPNAILQNFVQLASLTNVNLPSNGSRTVLYVDREAMFVNSIASITNQVTVQRGVLGTAAQAHISGATVFVGTENQFYAVDPSGACTVSQTAVTPWVNVLNGTQWTCTGGSWAQSGGFGAGFITSGNLIKTNNAGTTASPGGLWVNNTPPFGGLSVGTFQPGNDGFEDYGILLDNVFTDTTLGNHYGIWTLETGNTAPGNYNIELQQSTVVGTGNFGAKTYTMHNGSATWSGTGVAFASLFGSQFTLVTSAGSSAPTTGITGQSATLNLSHTGTTPLAAGYNVQASISNAATVITNNYGVRVQSPVGVNTSNYTHNYGIRVEDQSVVNAGLDSWSVFSNGGKSFFKDGLVQSNCAAVGNAANPSVVACGANVTGAFSCSTAASGGTCQVNTTAVTSTSIINITPRLDTATGTRLGVTCNATNVTVIPSITAISTGVSFTIQLGTIVTNPQCFTYSIESLT